MMERSHFSTLSKNRSRFPKLFPLFPYESRHIVVVVIVLVAGFSFRFEHFAREWESGGSRGATCDASAVLEVSVEN